MEGKTTKVDATISMETQMHTAGPICMLHFIARDVAHIVSGMYEMVNGDVRIRPCILHLCVFFVFCFLFF